VGRTDHVSGTGTASHDGTGFIGVGGCANPPL